MSRDQVVEKLGEPVSARTYDSHTYLMYKNGCEKTCGMNDLVILDSGKVVDAVFRVVEPPLFGHEQLAAHDFTGGRAARQCERSARGSGGRAEAEQASGQACPEEDRRRASRRQDHDGAREKDRSAEESRARPQATRQATNNQGLMPHASTVEPRPGDPRITPALISEHGLTTEEYDRLVSMLGREPTFTELGIVSALWSEHCSYKHSRPLLRGLPTTAPYVLQGPGENAGVISIGDGLAVAFKIESHNHPSAVEPYQGAATGVGGILRDVFTMGARPIAMLNSLRFGSLDSARVRYLFGGVVKGIGDYGNCVGIPTVAGEVAFDPSYEGNPLVNAMCVGHHARARAHSRRRVGRRESDHRRRRAHWPRRHSRRVVRVGGSLRSRATRSARACRSAIRSPKSCCSKRASS